MNPPPLFRKDSPEGDVPEFEREDDMEKRRKRMSYSYFASLQPLRRHYTLPRSYTQRGR